MDLLSRLRSVERLDKEECDAFTREAMLDAADEIQSLRTDLERILDAIQSHGRPPSDWTAEEARCELAWIRTIVKMALTGQPPDFIKTTIEPGNIEADLKRLPDSAEAKHE